ncbi:MAG: PQQ-dependent sugar dehydrogenase [Paracoccaceae bacterium]
MKRGIMLLLLIGGIWIGFTMGQSIPYIDLKLRSKYWFTPERALIETAQYPIWADFIDAPSDPGSGGQMALWGQNLLLVTRTGELHLMRPDRSGFDRLDIAAPFDFGALQDLIQLSDERKYVGAKGLELRRAEGGWELFVSHSNPHPDRQCSTLALSKLRLDGTGPGTRAAGDWRIIFETEPCIEAAFRTHLDQTAGILEFAPDGRLLMTVGDFGIDNHRESKETIYPDDPNVSYGKIFTINPDSGEASILTFGHRNPEGLTVAADGTIWSAEHGPAGGDELNLIIPGRHYGWPHVSYGSDYGKFFFPPSGPVQARHEGYEKPIFSWVPSIAVSALDQIEGPEFAFWEGDLIVASLVAERLFRLHLEEGPRVVLAEPIDLEARIRDVLVLPTGEIAAKLDEQPYVAILSNQVGEDIAFVPPKALDGCEKCHALGPASPRGSAPSLWKVWGRDVAAIDGYEYSAALRRRGGAWDEPALRAYLSDAEGFAAGTSMPDQGLAGAQLDAVIGALEGLQ